MCTINLEGMFSKKYYSRWICPECGITNMKENLRCQCGYREINDMAFFYAIFTVVTIIIVILGS
jgi:hypothetical protein